MALPNRITPAAPPSSRPALDFRAQHVRSLFTSPERCLPHPQPPSSGGVSSRPLPGGWEAPAAAGRASPLSQQVPGCGASSRLPASQSPTSVL